MACTKACGLPPAFVTGRATSAFVTARMKSGVDYSRGSTATRKALCEIAPILGFGCGEIGAPYKKRDFDGVGPTGKRILIALCNWL